MKKGAKTINFSKNKGSIGTGFFLIGALVSVLGGLISPGGLTLYLSGALIALGIAVGFLNITIEESTKFLLATVSLVIFTSLTGPVLAKVDVIGPQIESILVSILTFVTPAGIIAALKLVFKLAEN